MLRTMTNLIEPDEVKAEALLAKLKPWAAEARAMVRLALPLAGAQLAMIAIFTTDVLMIGRLGAEALAAASLGVVAYHFVWVSLSGPVIALAPVIAHVIGANPHDDENVRRALRMGLWTACCITIPALALLLLTGSILELLDQPGVLIERAVPYVLALLPGLPFSFAFLALRQFTTALSRPKPALYVMLFGIAVNAVGAYALIYGELGMPRLELVGAGIASAFATFAQFVVLGLIVLFGRGFKRYRALANFFQADWAKFKELFHIGLPLGGTSMAEMAFFSAAVPMMGLLGIAEVAAHQIAINIASVSFMVPLGVSIAGTVRVGMFAGARDAHGVRRAGWTCMGLGTLIQMSFALLFWIFPEAIVALYIDVNDPANASVVQLATSFLRIAAIFQAFDALQVTGVATLRGLKDTRVPMALAFLGYWLVGFPACWLLGFTFGLRGEGIWFGFVFGLMAAAIAMALRFQRKTGERGALP